MGRRKPIHLDGPRPQEILASRTGLFMTQSESADFARVSQSTWANWERGIAPMHPWIWEAWIRKAPLEAKRLRPFYFVSPSQPMEATPSSNSAGVISQARAIRIAEAMAKYQLSDEDCIQALGVSADAWQQLKHGHIMGMMDLQVVAPLERLGESRKPSESVEVQNDSSEAI